MKVITLSDIIAIIIGVMTPVWGKLIEVHFFKDSHIMRIIMPYMGVIGVTIYFLIVHNNRIKKNELYKKVLKEFVCSSDRATVKFFRDTFSEKEMKQLGFKEDEINKIFGASPRVLMRNIIPHYYKYLI